MKKTFRFLSMAALALMGAVMTGCSNEDNLASNQQPASKDNIVTVTTTIKLGGDNAGTRALVIDYTAETLTKTFAEGDQVVLMYEDEDYTAVKAVSDPLTAGDISADGKSAKLTFTLVNPREDSDVSFMYPAPLFDDDGIIKDSFFSQAGTLSDVASKDYAACDDNLTGTTLPASVTLENQFSIIAFTLKDDTGGDITGNITGMTISTGAENYTVTRTAADGPIYVIMRTTDGANINIVATDGANHYAKTLTGKTYAKNNFYQQGLLMAEAATKDFSTLSGDYEAQNGDILTGTLAGNHKISIADGAIVTIKDVNITNLGQGCNWPGIDCPGNATIILKGDNTVCAGRDGEGFNNYPGILIAPSKTLTIQGDGKLTAYSNNTNPFGAGIGGGYEIACGNIKIQGGTITATGGDGAAGIGGGNLNVCGDITISGGTITATGGSGAAGIGSGYYGICGAITITSSVTSVTATKGNDAPNSIGAGDESTCGTVTIGGTVTGNITTSPYTYEP